MDLGMDKGEVFLCTLLKWLVERVAPQCGGGSWLDGFKGDTLGGHGGCQG